MLVRGAVVAITGASAGIGRAAARAFAAEGARLALCARRLDLLESLAGELRAGGTDVLTMAVDVAEEPQVRALVEAAVARFSRLDVLVNNAGYGIRASVELTPAAQARRLMEVNYLGTLYGCQAAVPHMRAQKAGVIVNISSIVGHRSLPGGGAYAASKAAQISLTESLRVELHGSGVYACTVHPIGTATEFVEVAARESPGVGGGAVGPQQTAEQVARAIVACVRSPRPEVFPHMLSRVLVWLNAIAPSLVDWYAFRVARKSGRL